jgi:hypothetical protein
MLAEREEREREKGRKELPKYMKYDCMEQELKADCCSDS